MDNREGTEEGPTKKADDQPSRDRNAQAIKRSRPTCKAPKRDGEGEEKKGDRMNSNKSAKRGGKRKGKKGERKEEERKGKKGGKKKRM